MNSRFHKINAGAYDLEKCVVSLWQWPSNPRQEIPLPAQPLRLWFRIQLEAWMSDCVCSVFVFPFVGSGLEMGWSPIQGVLKTVCGIYNFRVNSEWEQAREHNLSR
jgi:hypothetical protein